MEKQAFERLLQIIQVYLNSDIQFVSGALEELAKLKAEQIQNQEDGKSMAEM